MLLADNRCQSTVTLGLSVTSTKIPLYHGSYRYWQAGGDKNHDIGPVRGRLIGQSHFTNSEPSQIMSVRYLTHQALRCPGKVQRVLRCLHLELEH